MKTEVQMMYLQNDDWYCVTNSLASALDYIGNYENIIIDLLKLAPLIDGKDFKYQAKIIKNNYNYAFRNKQVYGLGEVVIITKKKKLSVIHKDFFKLTDKLYIIFSKDYLVSLYNHYIFYSF